MKDKSEVKLVNIGILPKPEIKTIKCGDAEIEVASIIPYEDVFDMIQWCIEYIVDDRPFISEPVKQLIMDLAILKYYTNLDMDFVNPDARMVDIYSDYDMIQQSGLLSLVIAQIDENQLTFFVEKLSKTLQSIIQYKNSALGLIDGLTLAAKDDVAFMEKAEAAIEAIGQEGAIGNLLDFVAKSTSAPIQEK